MKKVINGIIIFIIYFLSIHFYHTIRILYKTIFFVKFIKIYYFSITDFILINLQIIVNILKNHFV